MHANNFNVKRECLFGRVQAVHFGELLFDNYESRFGKSLAKDPEKVLTIPYDRVKLGISDSYHQSYNAQKCSISSRYRNMSLK